MTAFRPLVVISVLISGGLTHAAGTPTPWKQSELNETYMRSITQSKCVGKLIATYEKACKDNVECLKTIAGASGDCFGFSEADVPSMCEYFPSQVTPACEAGRLTGLQCMLLGRLGGGFCDGSLKLSDKEIDLTPEEIFAKVSPGAVTLIARDAQGSVLVRHNAVVIKPKLVAAHCSGVLGSARITVQYQNREYSTDLKHSDPTRDVCTFEAALLKAPGVYVNPDGTRQLEVGNKLYVVGAAPEQSLSITSGLLSSFPQKPAGRFVRLIAPVTPELNGSGVYDQTGSLIGLAHFSQRGAEAVNLVTPIEWVAE